MRRLLLVCLFLILLSSTTFASPNPELSSLLERYEDLNLRFEVGLSYKDFSPVYQKLYIDTTKYINKNEASREQLENLLTIYKDIDEIWYLYVSRQAVALSPSNYARLYTLIKTKYPETFQRLKPVDVSTSKQPEYGYYTIEVVSDLPKYATEQIKLIKEAN